MVGVVHAAYTDRFHELASLFPHLVTAKGKRIERYVYALAPQIRGMVAATEPKTIQKAMQIAGTLTNEALRNGSTKKNHEKRGNGGEPSKDRNVRDDNKRTRTGNAFATTANPVRGGYTGTAPKVAPRNVNPVNARNPVARTCYECGSSDHIKSACPRLNQAQRPGGNPHNQVVAVNGGQVRGNQGNQARGRAFMLGAEEARFATTLFDSGALERCVPLDEIRVDSKLNFVEEPVEILEQEFKKLKQSRITIVKVRWNSKRGPKFTWEREDQMNLKYPHLFSIDSS
ncbi:reverse transcriptase domain-containing protein [Tanacetum coccineum]